MPIDVADRAASLVVINYWQSPPAPGNTTGKVTPKELYDSSVGDHVYDWVTLYGLVMHGTVGVDTLNWWLAGGSMQPGPHGEPAPYSMAHYLLPRDANTICKMAPSGKAVNHCGVSDWYDTAIQQPLNSYFLGIECEDLQNWNRGSKAQRITDDQHIKAGLIWAYESALDHQQKGGASRAQDRFVLSHSQIAQPWGRRSDPEAGLWNWDLFWYVVREIRMAENWPAGWPTRWTGVSPDV